MKSSVAILYFSLDPRKDARRKKWSASSKLNDKISATLYKSTKSKLRKTGLDVIGTDFNNNIPNTFGHQLAYAIESSFEKGYDQLIVVGNDCPDLKSNEITQVAHRLSNNYNSIGQTKKGGCYLFTIEQSQWSKQAFLDLPWCTSRLGKSLVNYLEAYMAVIQLPKKDDLNCLDDLQFFLRIHNNKLANRLGSLLSVITRFFYLESSHHNVSYESLSYRGPPQLV